MMTTRLSHQGRYALRDVLIDSMDGINRKILVFAQGLLLVSGALSASLPVSGADSKKTVADSTERPFGYHLQPILEAIKATPDQRKKISAIVEELRPTIEPLRKKFKEKQTAFLNGMTKGVAAEDLLVAQSELGQIRSEMNAQYMIMRLKVRKLLQGDQITAYQKYMSSQGWTHGKEQATAK